MRGRSAGIGSVLVSAAVLLAACGGGAAPSTGGGGGGAQGAPTVVVGILLPETGDLGDLGKPMVKGAELGFQAINDAGGVFGQKLKVVVRDDGTDENKGRDAMDQLVNVDKVSAVVGAAGSGISKAALQVAMPANVAMCSPASSSPDFTTMDTHGLFVRTAASDALQGQVVAQIASQEGYKTAAVIALNNPYGQGFAKVFQQQFPKFGGRLALDPVLYDPKGSTFTSEVQKVADAKPDVVVLVGYPDTGSIILKEAYQAGLFKTSHFLLSEGLKDTALPDKVGKDASGKYILAGVEGTAPVATGPAYDAFKAAFDKAYSGENAGGPYVANSYDCAVLIGLALQKVGPSKIHDGQAIAQAIKQIASPGNKTTDVKQALQLLSQGQEVHFAGASGSLNMDQHGDVLADYELWKIGDDGKIQTVKTVSPQS